MKIIADGHIHRPYMSAVLGQAQKRLSVAGTPKIRRRDKSGVFAESSLEILKPGAVFFFKGVS